MSKHETKSYDLKSLVSRLDKFERATDNYLFPECYAVIRLDGHRHGPDWRDVADEHYPFGPDIRQAFIDTTMHMFELDFKVRLGLQHGDEVIAVLDKTELNNLRKRTRLTSCFASAAAAYFVKVFQKTIIFHAQVSEFPSLEHISEFTSMIGQTARRNFISRLIQHELGRRNRPKEEIAKICSNLTEERVQETFSEIGIDISQINPSLLTASGFYWQDNQLKTFNSVPKDYNEVEAIVQTAFGVQKATQSETKRKPSPQPKAAKAKPTGKKPSGKSTGKKVSGKKTPGLKTVIRPNDRSPANFGRKKE